mgnify:CR=1 FL=1
MLQIVNNKYQPMKVIVKANKTITLEKRNTPGSRVNLNLDKPSAHMEDLESMGFITIKEIKG